MKTLKMLGVLFFISIAAKAQDLKPSEVPQELNIQFEKSYSVANDVEWEKENNFYKVEFEVDRMEHEIWYNAAGKQLKMEKEISVAELPQAIKNAIKTNYESYSIDDCEMRDENGTISYVVELDKWIDELEVVYDKNGKLLKEIK